MVPLQQQTDQDVKYSANVSLGERWPEMQVRSTSGLSTKKEFNGAFHLSLKLELTRLVFVFRCRVSCSFLLNSNSTIDCV
jgi:hypothetical protein